MMVMEKCFMKLGGDNVDTQWVCDNKIIYINKLIIKGGPGQYDVTYVPTLVQRMKAALGMGPTKRDVETMVRVEMLGEK
jgi:hypothetical protein